MIIDKKLPHAIFLDIDGTLMDHGKLMSLKKGHIHEKNAEAIKKARSLGHKVLINTGRGYACLPDAVFDEVTFDGFITGLGTHIEIDGKTVFNRPIQSKVLEEILDYIIKNNKACRFQGMRVALCRDPYQDLSPTWDMFATKQEFYEKLGDDFISKITVDREFEGEYRDFVEEKLNLYSYGSSGEAASKGCNKACGMKLALETLGIPIERSIAVGDSANDIEVLKTAGTSVAMGNAPEMIKEMCDYVTSEHSDGGVGHAIEKLLL